VKYIQEGMKKMKKKINLFVLTFVLVILTQILFSLPVFAEASITTLTDKNVQNESLFLKVTDSQIKPSELEAIYIIVGDEKKEGNYSYVGDIRDKTQKGANPQILQFNDIFYRIHDGYLEIEMKSVNSTARLLGNTKHNIIVDIILTEGRRLTVKGSTTGVFTPSSETPSVDDDKGGYLYKDFKYNSSSEHWAYDHVKRMSEIKIVQGTTEGYLYPDSEISLKEFISFLSRTLQYLNKANNKNTNNVYGVHMVTPEYNLWVKDDYVILMNALGIISEESSDKGKTELLKVLVGEENLSSRVTREEAAILMAAFLGDSTNTENPYGFSDWYKVNDKARMARLCELGVMFGNKDNTNNTNYLDPHKYITRVQALVLLEKFISIKDDIYVEPKSETVEEVTANDSSAPVITFTPNGGNVRPNSQVLYNVTDNESNITTVRYSWDNSVAKSIYSINKQTYSDTLRVPETPGKHTLKIWAKNAGGANSGWKEVVYTVSGTAVNDNTPPVISAYLGGNKVGFFNSIDENVKTITLKAVDNESGVTQIVYHWDNNPDTIANSDTVEVALPKNTNIIHILYVKAQNGAGLWAEAEYEYKDMFKDYEDDTTPPTISLNTTFTTISIKDTLEIRALDNESGVGQIVYHWDSENENVVLTDLDYEERITIQVPQTANRHILYVKAQNGLNNWSQEYQFVFDVVNSDYPMIPGFNDRTAPEISLNTTLKTISIKDIIRIKALDENGVAKISYRWDNILYKEIDCYNSKEIIIPVDMPEQVGKYTLYVTAWDSIGNYIEKTYVFEIVNSDNPLIQDGYGDGKNDATPPEITINTKLYQISTQDIIKITVEDLESGMNQIIYRWDSNTATEYKCDVYKMIIHTNVPQAQGQHTLYVKARNKRGKTTERSYTFNIIASSYPLIKDDEPQPDDSTAELPMDIIIDGDIDDIIGNDGETGNVVEPETEIRIVPHDQDEIVQIGYRWNNETEKIINGNELKINVPKEVGVHYLYVRLKNNKGVWSSVKKYKFEVVENLNKEKIKEVYVEIRNSKNDEMAFYQIYPWDSIRNGKIVIKAPVKEGSYKIYIKVTNTNNNIIEARKDKFKIKDDDDEDDNEDSNLVWKTKLPISKLAVELTKDGNESADAGMVTYPGNPELIGAINPNVNSLRVEIRNADNKLMFEPEEEVKYYIDFYNGTTKKIDDVKITFIIPEGFEGVSASNDGEIKTEEILWDIGSVKEGGGNRLTVVIKYVETFSGDSSFIPEANISIDDELEDTSWVYNMLYKSGEDSYGYHNRYVVGYPDGTFRPEGTITRAEMAAMCSKLFGLSASSGSAFSDLDYDHWANSAINGCIGAGLIDTYGEYFDPNSPATRAMFAIALARYLGVAEIEPIFINSTDTADHYAMREVEQLIRLGLVYGYPDGSAGPNKLVTRAEAVTMLNKYAFRGGLTLSNYNNYGSSSYIFKDLSGGHWALNEILEAALDHGYIRTKDGKEQSN